MERVRAAVQRVLTADADTGRESRNVAPDIGRPNAAEYAHETFHANA
jgi:hypothetical protein